MNWWQRLDAELRYHFDSLAADYMRQGLSETEVRRKARQEFGGLDQLKEECRDVHPLESLRYE